MLRVLSTHRSPRSRALAPAPVHVGCYYIIWQLAYQLRGLQGPPPANTACAPLHSPPQRTLCLPWQGLRSPCCRNAWVGQWSSCAWSCVTGDMSHHRPGEDHYPHTWAIFPGILRVLLRVVSRGHLIWPVGVGAPQLVTHGHTDLTQAGGIPAGGLQLILTFSLSTSAPPTFTLGRTRHKRASCE